MDGVETIQALQRHAQITPDRTAIISFQGESANIALGLQKIATGLGSGFTVDGTRLRISSEGLESGGNALAAILNGLQQTTRVEFDNIGVEVVCRRPARSAEEEMTNAVIDGFVAACNLMKRGVLVPPPPPPTTPQQSASADRTL